MKLLKTLLLLSAVVGATGITYMSADETLDRDSVHTIPQASTANQAYILQGAKPEYLSDLVRGAGGNVDREFPIINAISAVLTPQQLDVLKAHGGIRIQEDRMVTTMNNKASAKDIVKKLRINNKIARQTGATKLHSMGITGQGVTVAVIDSGANMGGRIGSALFRDTNSRQRVAVKYDAIRGRKTYFYNDDRNGHGTHIAGIVASSFQDDAGNYNGIAPDVHLLSVRAFDHKGQSSYTRVLDALNWVFKNRYRYKIRVVNMSLGVDASSHYWEDPINQAVMRLWDAGIVVVSSAGNNGQDAGITVPGNNPYVITVGALSDQSTHLDFSDDIITSFSSKGPTVEGFVKPEVVSFGSSIATKMDARYFKKKLKKHKKGLDYVVMSGTSQAAAIVSGIAALVISADPRISPDDVKCKIMDGAKAAHNNNKMAYSPFAQGAGMAQAYEAVMSNASECANVNLDIKQDLLGLAHFVGPSRIDENGNAYIDLGNGKVLSQGTNWHADIVDLHGITWGDGATSLHGVTWGDGSTSLHGVNWGDGITRLLGVTWGDGIAQLQGLGWSDGDSSIKALSWTKPLIDLQGIGWNDGSLNLQSLAGSMKLQSSDLDLAPIDPNVVVEVNEEGWQ